MIIHKKRKTRLLNGGNGVDKQASLEKSAPGYKSVETSRSIMKVFANNSTDDDDDDDEKDKFTNNDSIVAQNATDLGKKGLAVSGAILGAAGVEGARSAHKFYQAGKDLKELLSVARDKSLQAETAGLVRELGDRFDKYTGINTNLGEKAIATAKKAKSILDNTEFSKLDRMQRIWNYTNRASNLSRTVLNNAERWSEMAKDSALEKLNLSPLTEKENATLSKILKNGDHGFATQAESEEFLNKLKTKLSPQEFSMVQRKLENPSMVNLTKGEVAGIMDKTTKSRISEESLKRINQMPKTIGKVAKGLTHFKNAKLLGKIGVGIGGLSATAYYHGKSLQDFETNARDSKRLRLRNSPTN